MRTLQIAKAIAAHTSTKLALVLMFCISIPLLGSITVANAQTKRSSKSKAADTKKSKAADTKKSKAAASKKTDKNSKNAKNSRSDKKREDSRSAKSKSSKNQKVVANNKNSKNKVAAKAETKKDPRKMSKKERLAEARRITAEKRRAAEEARRRAIEEARRREAEFLQKLRDDSTTNIENDDLTGEDMEVRRVAINALGDKPGTVVVMNPKTGQVYSVVNQEWGLRKGFKPCSTVKLLTSVAGLTEGQIDPEVEANYSPNRLNLIDALAASNNPYFQSIGGRVGFEKMKSYAKDLGLGEKTGINMPNESPGAIPQEKTGYAVNHMSSHGDDFEITPIQLATMVSALGNGGKLLTPRVLKSEEDKSRFTPKVRRNIGVPQQTLDDILPGMVGAVNFGTARGAQTPGYYIAGKTGSCTGQGTKLGLFASYGPVGDPQLAVVVITRGPGQKGRVAAGIAGQIYRSLSYRFVKPESVPLARIPTAARQRNKPIDADEDDDVTETTAVQQKVDVNTKGNSTFDSKVQTINKTYPKKVTVQQPKKVTPTKAKPVQPKRIEPKKKQTVSTKQAQRPRIVRP